MLLQLINKSNNKFFFFTTILYLHFIMKRGCKNLYVNLWNILHDILTYIYIHFSGSTSLFFSLIFHFRKFFIPRYEHNSTSFTFRNNRPRIVHNRIKFTIEKIISPLFRKTISTHCLLRLRSSEKRESREMKNECRKESLEERRENKKNIVGRKGSTFHGRG